MILDGGEYILDDVRWRRIIEQMMEDEDVGEQERSCRILINISLIDYYCYQKMEDIDQIVLGDER